MLRKCCVPGCNSNSDQNIMLHKVPAASEKVMLWRITLTAVFDIFVGLSEAEFGKLFVCHKHFEAKYLSPKMRLNPQACPTLFTHEEIATGTPTTAEIVSMEHGGTGNHDHSYASKYRHLIDHSYNMSELSRNINIPVLVPSASRAPASEDAKLTVQAAIAAACQVTTPMDTGPHGDQAASSNLSKDQDAPMECILHADQTDSEASTVAEPLVDKTPASSVLPAVQVPLAEQASNSVNTGAVAESSIEKSPNSGTGAHTQTSRVKKRRIVERQTRKRILQSVKQMSPQCQELYKHYKKAKKQLDYRKRATMALKLSKEDSFKKLTKGMHSIAKKFLWMQVKLCTTTKKGRRFSLEEKVIALAILKQSPKTYRFLQRIFILPSKTTLNKLLSNVNIGPGINRQVINVIKQEVNGWNEAKKLCSIMFDEMKLDTGVHYARKPDKIDGFVELTEKTDHFADHALAFIIKGAVHKWQQPLAFYFSEGTASGSQMKAIIKTVVAAVCETGLRPIALISDQGTTFRNAFKSLQEETRRTQISAGEEPDDTIHLSGQSLSVVFDPPHLIKGVRNNFLTKNIVMNGKTSKWQDLVDVYRTDCRHAQARLLHKLNDEHILPEKIKKMKVRNCVRALSKTMAAALSYTASFSHYADGTPVSTTLENTAELVSFLDDLFDSVNGASTQHKHTRGKTLRTAVTETTEHHAFWKKSIEQIGNIKFVDRHGNVTSVPSLKNWVTTLKSYQRLWQVLSKYNIKIMRPRFFNSDAIENFFGRVRSYNARNNDPTCHAFACTFKSLLVTSLIKFHENTYNCEDDGTEQIIKIQTLFQNAEGTSVTDAHEAGRSVNSAPPSPSSRIERDGGAEQQRLQAVQERLHVHSRAYTAGWVIRKLLKSLNCADCEKDFTTKDENSIHKWISKREYNTMKKNKLTYPSTHAVRYFGNIVEESNEYLDCNAHHSGIQREIKEILVSKYSFDFIQCEQHKDAAKQLFIETSVTLCIFNWCNIINKILKGTDVSRLDLNNLPRMQAQALRKYNKKLKNKSLFKYMVILLTFFSLFNIYKRYANWFSISFVDLNKLS